jgi:hypothetical protein
VPLGIIYDGSNRRRRGRVQREDKRGHDLDVDWPFFHCGEHWEEKSKTRTLSRRIPCPNLVNE